MTIKIGQPHDEEYLEYLVNEYSRTDLVNDLPSWAYSKKEWEQKLLYRTYLRNKITLVKKEQKILEYLKEYKYEPKIPMQGRTEMVKLDLDIAVKVYEDVLDNVPLVTEAEPCSVCGKDKKFLVDDKLVCEHKCKEPKKRSKKH